MTRFPASASRAATVPPPAPEPMTRYSQAGGCAVGVDGDMAADAAIVSTIAGGKYNVAQPFRAARRRKRITAGLKACAADPRSSDPLITIHEECSDSERLARLDTA